MRAFAIVCDKTLLEIRVYPPQTEFGVERLFGEILAPFFPNDDLYACIAREAKQSPIIVHIQLEHIRPSERVRVLQGVRSTLLKLDHLLELIERGDHLDPGCQISPDVAPPAQQAFLVRGNTIYRLDLVEEDNSLQFPHTLCALDYYISQERLSALERVERMLEDTVRWEREDDKVYVPLWFDESFVRESFSVWYEDNGRAVAFSRPFTYHPQYIHRNDQLYTIETEMPSIPCHMVLRYEVGSAPSVYVVRTDLHKQLWHYHTTGTKHDCYGQIDIPPLKDLTPEKLRNTFGRLIRSIQIINMSSLGPGPLDEDLPAPSSIKQGKRLGGSHGWSTEVI